MKPTEFPRRVLILGSGPLKIGQAGEFDYSGTQALKALKEEGIYTVLVNPNIATIQTSHDFADQVYFLPLNIYFIEKVIADEKVDGILLSFGGQTALNCGLELAAKGILKKYNVRVLGTPVSVIEATEDREIFKDKLNEISVKTANSRAVTTPEEAVIAAKNIGFPVMLRAGFALGGKGSGVVNNEEECLALATRAFVGAPQVLVEESLYGWKEIEYEVVRDRFDNCVTICNMENLDPMGVHTGESIVVAPSQTLNDEEYQGLRDISIKTIRHLGVVGECNIQYALNPTTGDYRVIEVNARLSRSSALASKATGYPLAYIAAKLGLGYRLSDLKNAITKTTTAFFEPALDYIVCKIPRWDMQKFSEVEKKIGTEMKSVGEVMGIGKTFPEALQKALRMLEIGVDGLDPTRYQFADLKSALSTPSPKRIFAVAKAFYDGMSVDEVAKLTYITPFFLSEIQRMIAVGKKLQNTVTKETLIQSKKVGFSDKGIGRLLQKSEDDARMLRQSFGVRPCIAQIDTLAAEYPAETNYLYMTYGMSKSDVPPTNKKKILVLGSGCYRIGSSVEFDWCAVNTVMAARESGFETILVNCNPETVSTDYDICDKLIFDEITLETVLEIVEAEKPDGVVVSMGGQTPNNLALKLHKAGVPILGTTAESIDRAEDRGKFSALLDSIGCKQPSWIAAHTIEDLDKVVNELGGYPVLTRPSYVLSGAAMRVVYSGEKLKQFLTEAAQVSPEHPVVLSKFELDANEIELDAVAKNGEILLWAVSEHIENAGVHSGDATLVFPPQKISRTTIQKVVAIGRELAKALNITGPFNIQLLLKEEVLKVIECNLRASRSFPFVSKVLGTNFIREATRMMLGLEATKNLHFDPAMLDFVAVKAPQFSFDRLRGADPRIGVEMASTGEVACFGDSIEEALLKSVLASGFKIPSKGALLMLDSVRAADFRDEALNLKKKGFEIYALPKTANALQPFEGLNIVNENDGSAFEIIKSGKVDVVISSNVNLQDRDGYTLRRAAIDFGIPMIGEMMLAKQILNSLNSTTQESLKIKPWKHYLNRINQGKVIPFRKSEPLKLFIRQPFTETSAVESKIIHGVLELLNEIHSKALPLDILTGNVAHTNDTFKKAFETETGKIFNPKNFRAHRLGLLDAADAMIVIRTSLSESGSFELAYNIYGGKRIPVFYAIWDQTPIKTTLIRDLDDLVDIEYVTFKEPADLKNRFIHFLQEVGKKVAAQKLEQQSAILKKVKQIA